MIVRNFTVVAAVGSDRVISGLRSTFESRQCAINPTGEPGVFDFLGLMGTSSIVRGGGLIAIVEDGTAIRVRSGLNLPLTLSGLFLFVLAFVVSVFSIYAIGVCLVLFWLLRDQACASVEKQLDAIINEVTCLLETR